MHSLIGRESHSSHNTGEIGYTSRDIYAYLLPYVFSQYKQFRQYDSEESTAFPSYEPTALVDSEELTSSASISWDYKKWFSEQELPLCVAERKSLQISTPRRKAFLKIPTPTAITISKLEYNRKISFASALVKKLNLLVEESKEDYPYQEPISNESLKDFIEFLEFTPKLDCPEFSSTPAGNIRAEWHESNNRHFAVQFLGNDDVQYVIFSQDPNHPNKINRTSALDTTMSLMEHVESYNVLDWASNSVEAG